MKTYTFASRAAAVAVAAGIALTPAATGIAFAQTTTATAPASLVDAAHAATFTVHKKANPTTLAAPTGESATVSGTDLANVGFTIYKINGVDLTTNEGLAAAQNLKVSDYYTNGAVDTSKVTQVGSEQLTGSNGETSWTLTNNLGAYLVVETTPAAGYEPAAPFIAFVPMTSNNATTGGTTWNYDVIAYPKNYKGEVPTKTVQDRDQNSGDKQLVYSISANAAAINPDKTRTQFILKDQIDPRLTVQSVTVTGTNLVGGATLAAGDYTVDTTNNLVTVTLTDSGLAKLQTGSTISADITTSVNAATTDPSTLIPNTAQVYQNNPDGSQMDTSIPGTPTNTVKTYWGGLNFKKVGENRQDLPGAEFQVYRAAAGQDCNAAVANSQPVNATQGGTITNTFTSDAAGNVLLTGLHVNDFENNMEVAPANQSTYCLVETKSPSGYELLADPIQFKLVADTVTPDDPATPDVDESNRTYKLATVTVGDNTGEVVNLKDTTFFLPSTGGKGIAMLAGFGLLVMAAGALWARRNTVKA